MDPVTLTAISLAAKYVPDIIGYFKGDKAADVAGKVIDIAQTVTGTKTPEQAVDALAKNPELQVQFQLAVMAEESKIQAMYLADTQNARQRDVDLAKAGFRNRRGDIMLGLTYLGLVALVSIMVYKDIDANTALGGVVILLIGKFIGQWDKGFDFEFGTTRSSKAKDVTIDRLVAK